MYIVKQTKRKKKRMYEIDCHGLTKKDMIVILNRLYDDTNIFSVKFITGKGNHSKKPIMDYYCQKEWKSPLKETIMNYIIHEKKEGALLQEFPAYLLWRKRPKI